MCYICSAWNSVQQFDNVREFRANIMVSGSRSAWNSVPRSQKIAQSWTKLYARIHTNFCQYFKWHIVNRLARSVDSFLCWIYSSSLSMGSFLVSMAWSNTKNRCRFVCAMFFLAHFQIEPNRIEVNQAKWI